MNNKFEWAHESSEQQNSEKLRQKKSSFSCSSVYFIDRNPLKIEKSIYIQFVGDGTAFLSNRQIIV